MGMEAGAGSPCGVASRWSFLRKVQGFSGVTLPPPLRSGAGTPEVLSRAELCGLEDERGRQGPRSVRREGGWTAENPNSAGPNPNSFRGSSLHPRIDSHPEGLRNIFQIRVRMGETPCSGVRMGDWGGKAVL